MKRLYEYLLNSEYTLEHYFCDKAFTFNKKHGDWNKSITISKYGKEYKVRIIEGYSNLIKTQEVELKTYKEVIDLIY